MRKVCIFDPEHFLSPFVRLELEVSKNEANTLLTKINCTKNLNCLCFQS